MGKFPRILKPEDILRLNIVIREFRKLALIEPVKVIPVNFKTRKVIR